MFLIKLFQKKFFERYKCNYKKFLKMKNKNKEIEKNIHLIKNKLSMKDKLISEQKNDIEQLKSDIYFNSMKEYISKEVSTKVQNSFPENHQEIILDDIKTFFESERIFWNFLWENYRDFLIKPKQLYLNSTKNKKHNLFILNIKNEKWFFLCLNINNITNKEFLSKDLGFEAIERINQYIDGNNNKIVLLTNCNFRKESYFEILKKATELFSSNNTKLSIIGFSKVIDNFEGLIIEGKIFK